jgi:RNA polymerase sigma-70 factor, ECF subfamily
VERVWGEALDKRSRDELEQAYRDVAPDLWRAVFVYAGGERDVADEAVAEAFAQAGEEMEQIRDLRPWLYSVAFRIARKELKHRRQALLREPVAGADAAEHRGATTDVAVDITRALRHLSPSQRGVFVLRDVYGYSTAGAAQILRMSEVAVRVHLHAARRRLRERLGEVDVL